MNYPGPERRSTCDAHEKNTTDLSSLKSATNTMKWVIGLGLPVATAMLLLYFNTLSTTLREIRMDLKEIKYEISQAAIMDATTRIEVEQLKKDVSEIKLEIVRIHSKEKTHGPK